MTSIGGYDAVEGQDPYCYDGTTVLKNLLQIQDPDKLEAFELEMSTLRAAEPLPEGGFDRAHYQSIHHHLFQDVYAWAGERRTVDTSKGGNLFCLNGYIDRELDKLLLAWSGDPADWCQTPGQFADDVAELLGELNAIHMFREGNGRAQLAFVHLLGQAAGSPFDLSLVQRDSFLPAMIASFHGQLAPLKAQLKSFLVTS